MLNTTFGEDTETSGLYNKFNSWVEAGYKWIPVSRK